MKFHIVTPILLVCVVVSFSLFTPTAAPSRPRACEDDPFGPVFQIMNQERGPTSMGCRGCHIGDSPGSAPWWGRTQAEVLQSLETGVTFDGMKLDNIPVEGGRDGVLGQWLTNGNMPLFGERWRQDQLENVLYPWLDQYGP